MMEDRRAHERIETLETTIKKHIEDHARFETSLNEIASNTKELVELVRGARGLRAFIVWATPIAVFLAAIYTWLKVR